MVARRARTLAGFGSSGPVGRHDPVFRLTAALTARRLAEAALGGCLLVFGATVLAYATGGAESAALALGPLSFMGLATAVLLVAGGAALLLPSKKGWRSLQAMLGAAVALGALATLLSYAAGDAEAGRWRVFLSALFDGEVVLNWPGRLSLPVALALLCAGAVLVLTPRVASERGYILLQVLTGIVAYVGAFGIIIHASGLGILCETSPLLASLGWPASMAVLALGIGVGLRLAGRSWFARFYLGRPERQVFAGTLALMLLLLTVSWSVGMGMFVKDAVTRIEKAELESLRGNSAVLEDIIWETRTEAAEVLALCRLGELLSRSAADEAVEAEIRRVIGISRHNGLGHVAVRSADSTLAVSAGSSQRRAAVSMGLRNPQDASLVWADRLVLIVQDHILDGDRRVGLAQSELSLDRADARIWAWQASDDGRRTVLCGAGEDGPVCVQLGGGRVSEYESRWVSTALDGAHGVQRVSGPGRPDRMLTYGPVGDTGLIMIDEVPTGKLLAPLHTQSHQAVAMLLALAAGGTLIIYWRTGPSLRRLAVLQAELQAIVRNVPAGIVTMDSSGRIVSANPRAEQILGRSVLEGQQLSGFIDGAQGLGARELQNLASPSGDGNAGAGFREVAVATADGGVCPVELAIGECAVAGRERFVAVLIDATERKRFEEKLKSWAHVFEHGGWGVLIAGPDGRTKNLNSAFARMHGYTVQEALQLPAEHFFAEEARGELVRLMEEVRARGRARCESLRRRADGTVFPALIDLSVVRDDEGRVRYEVMNVQDISEIRRASEALRRNEALLRRVLETLPVGVWVADASGTIVLGNSADQRIWGGARYEDVAQYKGWRIGSEKNIEPGEWGLMRALTRGEAVLDEVINIQAFDGSLKSILHSSVPLLDESGRVQGAIAVNEDITERERAAEALRQSHEFFRSIFQDTSVGVALIAPDGRWLAANRALTRIIGYSEDELLGMAFQDVTHPDDLEKDVSLLEGMLSGRLGHHQGMEKRYLRKGGGMVWVLLSVSLVRNENAEPEYFIAQIQDISERKAVEEELLRSREQLRELAAHHEAVREEERKRIAMEVHDELGQLLTALKIEISLVRMRFAGDPELTGRIAQMRRLVEETISMVRNVANHLRPTALNLGLAAALEWLTQDFSKRTQVPCTLEIWGDDAGLSDRHITALFRIVQESLTNVARHARAQAVSIRLEHGDGWLSLEVQDDGRGFDTRLIGGTESFGLLGIRERVVMLGGTVRFVSEPGKGTTIVIRIPLAPAGAGQ